MNGSETGLFTNEFDCDFSLNNASSNANRDFLASFTSFCNFYHICCLSNCSKLTFLVSNNVRNLITFSFALAYTVPSLFCWYYTKRARHSMVTQSTSSKWQSVRWYTHQSSIVPISDNKGKQSRFFSVDCAVKSEFLANFQWTIFDESKANRIGIETIHFCHFAIEWFPFNFCQFYVIYTHTKQ